MTERRRQYTKREKAAIVGKSETVGVRRTAREAGIPVSTVDSWRHRPEFGQLRTQKREEVQADVWAAFQMGVRRIVELIPLTDDLNKVSVATGIIFDKHALMSGQVTSRTETVTGGMDDHEREALRHVIDEVLAADQ